MKREKEPRPSSEIKAKVRRFNNKMGIHEISQKKTSIVNITWYNVITKYEVSHSEDTRITSYSKNRTQKLGPRVVPDKTHLNQTGRESIVEWT